MRIETESVEGDEKIRRFKVDFPITTELLEKIEAVEGVESLGSCLRYTAIVYRGDLFRWDEVEPRIKEALAT